MAKCKICECEFKRTSLSSLGDETPKKSTLSNEKVYSLTLDDTSTGVRGRNPSNERCEECCYKIFLFLQSCGELLM